MFDDVIDNSNDVILENFDWTGEWQENENSKPYHNRNIKSLCVTQILDINTDGCHS